MADPGATTAPDDTSDVEHGPIAAAVRRPVATTMLAAIIAVVGLIAAYRLPVDLLPEVVFPTVSVYAPYPGVGAEEMEALVLEPLEDAVATVPGLRHLNSRTSEGSAVLWLEFSWDTDLAVALDDVRVAVERARSNIPDDIEAPQVFRFNPNQFPIVFLQIGGDDLFEVTRIVRDEIRPRIARLEGVAAVDLRGSLEREVRLELDLARMLDLQVTPDDVARAVASHAVDVSGGKVLRGGSEVGLRTLAKHRTLDDLRRTVVANKNGTEVRVADIADVVLSPVEAQNIVESRGRPAMRVGARKIDGENTIEVAARVRAEADRLALDYPQLDFAISLDQSRFIEDSLNGAKQAALVGALFALAVLLLFLRSFRATLLVGISIPTSVLAAFLLMDRAGFSLNLMTLGGLALGVGMLVDNAVVVLEAIFVRLKQGESGRVAAVRGAREVGLAVLASTATTLVIFIPVLFLEGNQRILYGELAMVVSVALAASLLLSLTVVPALAGQLYTKSSRIADGGAVVGRLERWLDAVLQRALHAPGSTLVIAAALFLGALSLWPQIQTEYMPAPEADEIRISVELPIGTPIETTAAASARIAAAAESLIPEAVRVSTTVGPSGWWSSRTGEVANISIELPPKQERPRETLSIVGMLRKKLPRLPGVQVGVRPGGGFFLLRMIRGGSGEDSLSVEVRGDDLDDMFAYADQVKAALESVAGIKDVIIPRRNGRDELGVRVNESRAVELGLYPADVGAAVETYVRGRRVGTLQTKLEDLPVVVRLTEADRKDPGKLKDLLIYAPAEQGVVPLSDLAQLEEREGPISIERAEGYRRVGIGASVEGRAVGEVADEARAKIAALKAPKGVFVTFTGEAEKADELSGALLFGGLFALMLVFMVMAAQFESLVLPMSVMGAVPFAGIGVVLLFGSGLSTFNTYSFLGIVVLVGLSVNNAIVLVDAAARLQIERGLDAIDAARAAARRRLRPILMTSTTTLLGLLPVAVSTEEGAELQGPLARVVVAGLLTSTVVSLVVVPVLYSVLARWFPRRS